MKVPEIKKSKKKIHKTILVDKKQKNLLKKKKNVKKQNSHSQPKVKPKKKVMEPVNEEWINEMNEDDDESQLSITAADDEEYQIIEKKSKTKEKMSTKKNESGTFGGHKKDIEKLKDIDPEFYKFLKDNDKELLDFNWSDTDDDDDDDDVGEKSSAAEEPNDEDIRHQPKDKLEVASDEESDEEEFNESDESDSDFKGKSNVVTLKLLRSWEKELQTQSSIETIRNVLQAFNSALASISDGEMKGNYKVEGAAAFNGVIQICVLHLKNAVHKFVGFNGKLPIHKTKKWPKIRNALRYYFIDLIKLLENVSSINILTVLLKHLHQMSDIIAGYPTISKPVLKRLITLWSTSDDTVRILSFLCILKITRNQRSNFLNHVLRAMYLAYVRNSKFVNPNSLPGINFMRRSLVEILALDLNIAYQHGFLYIRQLAIHLRNAIILKKKESFQAVYNWQFINSIQLWSDLLGATANKPQLQPLIYPLTSITIGVIKLISTAQFFPLRFHCIQTLISLGRQTNTFIPIMPFILEVLNSNTFNKKHTSVSMKPMSFACILRLNKSQLAENGFRDEVIEQVSSLTLDYLENYSSSIAYCDLVVPTVINLKKFTKNCKNSNHSKKMKQILDKITENSKFIENERKKINNFTLKDVKLIQAWENNVRQKKTPLSIYHGSWVKTHEIKKKRQAAQSDDFNDYDLPLIKRKKLKMDDGEKSKIVELFPDDESEIENEFLNDNNKEEPPKTRNGDNKISKEKKKKKKQIPEKIHEDKNSDDEEDNNMIDIVKDLDVDDW